jgi:hypothetical protein
VRFAVDWVNLAHNQGHCWSFVNMAMNVRVRGISYYVSHYQLSQKATVSLSLYLALGITKAGPSTAPSWPTRNVLRSESAFTIMWHYKPHNLFRKIFGVNTALSFVNTNIFIFVYSSDCSICWNLKAAVRCTDIKPPQSVDQSNN